MKDSQFITAPSHANNNGGVMSGGGGVRREEGGGGGGAGGPGFPPPHWPPHPLHHQLGSHHSQHLPRMLGGYFGGRGVTPTAAHSGGFGGGWQRGSPGQGGGATTGLKPPERWSASGPAQQQVQQQAQAEGGMDLSQTRSNGSQPNGLAKEGVSVIASNPLRDTVVDKLHDVGDGSEEEDEDCMVIEEGEEAPRESHANTVVGGNNAAPAPAAPPRHRLHGDPSIAQEAPPLEAPPHHPGLHRHHSGSGGGGSHQLPASVAQPARSEARAGDSGGHRLPVSVQGLTRPTSPSLHAHQAMQFAKQILAQKQLQDSQLLTQHKLGEAAYQQLLSAQTLVPPNPESAHQLLAQGKLQQGLGGSLIHQRGDPATGSLYQVPHHKTSHSQPEQPSPAHLYKPAGAAPVPPPAVKVGGACKAEEVRAAVGSPSQSGAQAPGVARTENRPSSSASLPPNLGLNLPASLQVIPHPAGSAVPALTPAGLEMSSRNRQERRVDRSESPSSARSEPVKPLPTQASAPLGARLTDLEASCRQPPVDQVPVPDLPSRTHQPAQVPGEVLDRGREAVSTATEPDKEESQQPSAEDDKDRVESMLENMFQQEVAAMPDRSSDPGEKMTPASRLSPALTEVNVVEILQDKGDEPSPLAIKQEIKTEVEDEEERGGEGVAAVGTGSAFMEVESELEKMFAGIVEAGGEGCEKAELPESAGSWTKGTSSAKSNKRGPRLKRQPEGGGGTAAKRKNGKSATPMSASDKLKKRLHPRTEKIKEGSNDSSSISTGQMYKWRGPYIRVRRGQDGRPASVTLVNSGSADEERPDHRTLDKSAKRKAPRIVEGRTKGPGLYSSTLSSKYNSMVMDVTWTCIFCNRRSHCENGLGGEPAGDLFGPYVVEVKGEGCGGGGAVSDADVASEQRKRGGGKQLSLRAGGKANHSFTPPHKKARKLSSSESGGGAYTESGGSTTVPGAVSMDVWVHEACAVWAPGVILVGPHLIGLDEAVSLSLQSKCSVCGESGACISCLQHGCQRVCHYGCARTTQWSLDEQTFHARCLDHKKPITLSLALQQHSTI